MAMTKSAPPMPAVNCTEPEMPQVIKSLGADRTTAQPDLAAWVQPSRLRSGGRGRSDLTHPISQPACVSSPDPVSFLMPAPGCHDHFGVFDMFHHLFGAGWKEHARQIAVFSGAMCINWISPFGCWQPLRSRKDLVAHGCELRGDDSWCGYVP